MTDQMPHPETDPTLPRILRWRLGLVRFLTGLFLFVEKSLENLWPLILWVSAFASLWLLQIPSLFGRGTEIGVAVLFIAGFFFFMARALPDFILPRRGDVTRRIEQDSNLPHRPLSGLDDRLANPAGQNTLQLWSYWQSRLRPALQALRWPAPHPVLTQIDPFAFRALALVVLIAALVMAGPSWPDRLKHGLVPVVPSFAANTSDNIVLWITPPDYTGQKQIVLKGKEKKGQIVSIPEGSVIKARVNGWFGTPSILFDDQVLPMEKMGKASYGIETTVPAAEKITIRQLMIPRASWAIAYGTDLPPTIVQKGDMIFEPAKGDIKIPLTVQDDYSVEGLTTTIRLDSASIAEPPPFGNVITEDRSVMSTAQTPMDFTPKFNLAWHPWAGMDVVMDIEIRDHRGQTASLKDLHFTIPDRAFRHPVARKLIELRKRLIWTPEAAAHNVGYEIEKIMAYPPAYHNDGMVFLSLRTIASRLFYNTGNAESTAAAIAQLWDTALRIEDGNFSMAQRNLQQAQQNLQDALKDPNTTPEEIAGLMEELRMAMAQYMQEAFREMQKRMAENGVEQPMMSPDMFMNSINPEDLAAFMDKMQAEAMSGDRNAAREMLSQMERLMEMMDPSSMQMEMPEDMQAMMEGMEKLQELIDGQKKLKDDTQRLANEAGQVQSYSAPLPTDPAMLNQLGLRDMPPPPQDTRTGEQAPQHTTDSSAQQAEQEALRKTLGDLMLMVDEKIGAIPENMGKADQAMKDAAGSLEQNMPGSAVPHQDAAIKHLSDSQQQMGQQLAERMKQMMMLSFGMGPTDPLGRPMNEGENGMPWSASKVKIPEEAERKRIHEILESLRKKSGELQRPEYELDYYRRLMRQF
jgi:uncharacterized protein (TIGR02302 family)